MKKILFASAMALSLISCRENKTENTPLVENAVDNAESSISGSLKSGRYGNQVHEIYNELIKNNKSLLELDKRIEKVDKETETVISKYSYIIDKSERYYNDAKTLSNSVTDSLAKIEIGKAIQRSSDQYTIKNQAITDLIKKITANRVVLHDQYIIFKIKKTLPEIEKYQNAHPLKTDNLNNIIKKQDKLLEELKNLK
ncbi:hypothetical protein EG347_03585 [Chryseobacterium sp. G0186]|uniref:hypothetical protein n=1 Tax=Chryseobacterium sp. G0186 TaxID=2487064 RepID=UPI000F4DBA78|nr:hypothetical protein [Chryseobacterium sp. G0186]AZA76664.1 hypothetical protein EG347_03585 [Chryseobacterium sp. G0186]